MFSLSNLIIISATDTRPQSLGLLKNKVKLDHLHTLDKKCNCFHRLLHITKLGPDLSGNFTCSVSTLQSEDTQTKPMLVVGKSRVCFLILLKFVRDESSSLKIKSRDALFSLGNLESATMLK